jgi:predicted SAM-dependent methyltransferase
MSVRLHLGCGSTVVPGWENIDKSPSILLARVPGLRPALARAHVINRDQANATFPPGIVRADVTRGLAYPDGSAEFVYSSHMIEHIPRWQALALLRECHRVLVPGGAVRIATPDLAEIVERYRTSADGDYMMQSLGHYTDQPGSPVASLLRRLFTGSAHQWLYDEESLTKLFAEAGFVDAARRAYHDSAIPDIALLEDRPESLIVEARRP